MIAPDAPNPGPKSPGNAPIYPSVALRVAADYGWRLLVLGAVGFFAVRLLSHLALVVIPFIASLLVTALLRPVLNFFRNRGLSRGVGTLATLAAAVIVFGGIVTLVVVRAANEAPQLGDEINSLIPQVKHWLITGPLQLNPTSVNNISTTVTKDVSQNSSTIASAALSTGKAVADGIGGAALTAFLTVFLLYDGDRVWDFLLRGAPAAARPRVNSAGQAAWRTLSHYVRGTLIVATFHGVVVAITLTILGVPLAFPLAVLVGLGSFVPLVGAFLTGGLAVAVAGLSKGAVAALIVLGILLADNQIEAHLLQPFVVGRYVRIHPLAVVLALGTGAILFGIVGAVVAVPVVACLNSAVRAARDQPREGEQIPSRGG